MKKTDQPMYEYACPEGNYSMFTMLEGARAADRIGEPFKGSNRRGLASVPLRRPHRNLPSKSRWRRMFEPRVANGGRTWFAMTGPSGNCDEFLTEGAIPARATDL